LPAIERLKKRAGRFVLATNELEKKRLSSEDILKKYKGQQAPERGFSFLKDPCFFAHSVFLKSPHRIEVMAMLMGLCLLVYTIGQRQVRLNLKQQETGLKNQLGKLTDRPTLRWIFQNFQGIHLRPIQDNQKISNLTKLKHYSNISPLDVKSDCPVILNKHCLLRMTGGTLKFSA
jgi:transposase